ncbi:MAG: hypothetical protein RLZZ555_1484 [Pseudomonadota bacterium]|jgi:hypothetical protein
MSPELWGCDFSSAPSRRKPVVLAIGRLDGDRIGLERIETFETLPSLAARLAQPGRWTGGFDLPFGLPRELVEALGWPSDWLACMRHYAALGRDEVRAAFAAFCAARPVGTKFAHRATDRPASSSPSMKWVNPPVAFMLHAGVPLLLDAGVSLPGLREADPERIALEAYPGLLARSVLGARSYKSDDKAKQTPGRLQAREQLLQALLAGEAALLRGAGLSLELSTRQQSELAADASGDRLDALLCLLQAAWALRQRQRGHPRWGLPEFDPLEGWIVGA